MCLATIGVLFRLKGCILRILIGLMPILSVCDLLNKNSSEAILEDMKWEFVQDLMKAFKRDISSKKTKCWSALL